MHGRLALAAVLVALALGGCARVPVQTAGANTAPRLRGDRVHPGTTKGWVETKLYFGLSPADRPDKEVSEEAWRAFLDREVTPRFPNGLSVLDVYGQWQGRNETSPERLRTKCLIIDYPDTADNRAKVEALRVAWKQKTGDQSVMRVTVPADVSF